MVKAQEWLDKNYPKEKRGEILSLNIGSKKLEGSLDLSDFVNLKELNCRYNQLISLDISNCKKLIIISAYSNKINQDLKIFSHLTELKKLDLGTNNEKCNNFYGSLKNLENCKKLRFLCIGHCNQITKGLEYLPSENLYWFGCHGTVFTEILKPYAYNVEAWQKKDTRKTEVLKVELLLKKNFLDWEKEEKESKIKLTKFLLKTEWDLKKKSDDRIHELEEILAGNIHFQQLQADNQEIINLNTKIQEIEQNSPW